MALTTLKCIGCNIVICEVLSYIQYKHDVMDNESLVKICESAFSDKEIEQAKLLLFESLPNKQRKIARRKEGKTKRNVEDIISIFKEVDPDTIPVFVARDLQKLPPVSIDHVDVITLLKDITKLKNDIADIKVNYATVAQVREMQNQSADKETENIAYCDNVNKRKRGEYLLDSGPIGLSPSINFTSEGGIYASADSNPNGNGPSTSNSASESSVALVDGVHSPSKTSDTRVISVAPAHKSIVVSPQTLQDSKRVSFVEMVSREGEWNQSNAPDDNWQLYQRKRLRNRFIGKTGKAVTEPQSKFKAAVTKVPLFISNVSKDACETDICDYIQAKTNETITMEKIKMKVDRPYNAFKIFVSEHKLNLYLNDELWPNGIRFRRFVHVRMRPTTLNKDGSDKS